MSRKKSTVRTIAIGKGYNLVVLGTALLAEIEKHDPNLCRRLVDELKAAVAK
jgi:hypothetical protein